MNTIKKCILGLSILGAPLLANAALIPVNGGAVLDDTDNNTMWLNDGNSFYTMSQANGDPVSLMQAVIAASNGVVADTANSFDTPAYSGQYLLGAQDFDLVTGRMSWWGAQAWINYLNSINYQGYSDWRQPTIVDAPSSHRGIGTAPGYTPPTTGELTQLFYVELGEGGNAGVLNANSALFANLQPAYWYGTESLSIAAAGGGAWVFAVANGPNPKALKGPKGGGNPAFPMRTGQAPLVDLVASIQSLAKSAGTRKPDTEELHEANDLLRESCEELSDYSRRTRAPGNTSSATSILAADTQAIAVLIGCK